MLILKKELIDAERNQWVCGSVIIIDKNLPAKEQIAYHICEYLNEKYGTYIEQFYVKERPSANTSI